MNKKDQDIQKLFQKKLGEFESEVPDTMWTSISSKLPVASSPVTSSNVFTNPFTKWLIGGAASLATVVALVFTYTSSPTAIEEDKKSIQQEAPIPAPVESTSTQNETNSAEIQQIAPSPNQTSAKEPTDLIAPAATMPTAPMDGREANTPNWQGGSTSPIANQSSVSPRPANPVEPTTVEETIIGEFGVQKIGETGLSYFFIPKDDPKNSFQWDFGNGKTSNALSPNHVYDQEGMFTVTLTVTSPEGQLKSTAQTICVYRPGKIKAPNAFSPGNDSSNEYFDLRSWSTNIASYKEFVILDSNGKPVFRSLDTPLWDGTDAAGNACLTGNYTFTVICFDWCDQRIVKAGPIRLFRP